jgi:hypothetical protein
MIFIPKKDGTQQRCMHHHPLNEVIIKNKYLLPRMHGMFDQLHGVCVL